MDGAPAADPDREEPAAGPGLDVPEAEARLHPRPDPPPSRGARQVGLRPPRGLRDDVPDAHEAALQRREVGPRRASTTSTRTTSTPRTRCSPTSTSARPRRTSAATRSPKAWQIAFDTAARDDTGAVQDMLLGINAHVQNDMPFVLASLGLTTPKGDSRKPDHDEANGTLNRAYEDVVAEVKRALRPGDRPLESRAGAARRPRRARARPRVARERVAKRREAPEREGQAGAAPGREADRGRSRGDGRRRSRQAALPGYGATRDAYCAAGPSGD